MRVVTVGRKPCKGGVTANVTEYEAGALNIDGTTIGSRWPANAIFEHLPACRLLRMEKAKGYVINRWSDGAKPFGGGAGHEFETEVLPDEEIEIWECEKGCPVALRDPLEARCFKGVQRDYPDDLPVELWDYLMTLIAPPKSCEPNVILNSLDEIDWDHEEDGSVHGVITVGNPEPFLEQLDRVLRPGAHVLLLSPADEPTGWEGACALEEFGYEIRDAIALVDRDDDYHYVSKPSGKEKHAGVLEHLDPKTGRKVQNNHETVKPVDVMRALLRDVPGEGAVVDPFLGSGTTAIACLHTGHDFVGIEESEDYLVIADQRVRHWDRALSAWRGSAIQSEAPGPENEDGPLDLGDLFGIK